MIIDFLECREQRKVRSCGATSRLSGSVVAAAAAGFANARQETGVIIHNSKIVRDRQSDLNVMGLSNSKEVNLKDTNNSNGSSTRDL